LRSSLQDEGWKTRTFTENKYAAPSGNRTAERGTLMVRFRTGVQDYALGGHPLWELFRTVYQMTKRPFVREGWYWEPAMSGRWSVAKKPNLREMGGVPQTRALIAAIEAVAPGNNVSARILRASAERHHLTGDRLLFATDHRPDIAGSQYQPPATQGLLVI